MKWINCRNKRSVGTKKWLLFTELHTLASFRLYIKQNKNSYWRKKINIKKWEKWEKWEENNAKINLLDISAWDFVFIDKNKENTKTKCISVGTKWINTTQNIFTWFFAYWYISPTDIQIRSLHFRLCEAKPEVKSLNMGVYRLTTLWNRLTSWYRRRGKNKPKMPHLFCLSKGVRLCEQQPFFLFRPTVCSDN